MIFISQRKLLTTVLKINKLIIIVNCEKEGSI